MVDENIERLTWPHHIWRHEAMHPISPAQRRRSHWREGEGCGNLTDRLGGGRFHVAHISVSVHQKFCQWQWATSLIVVVTVLLLLPPLLPLLLLLLLLLLLIMLLLLMLLLLQGGFLRIRADCSLQRGRIWCQSRRWPEISSTMGMVATLPLLAIPMLVKITDLRLVDALCDTKIAFSVSKGTVFTFLAIALQKSFWWLRW